MSGSVDLQFSASDRAAQQAWQSQQRLADGLIRKLEKLEQVSKRTGGGLKFPSLGGFGSQLTGIVASFTTLATVIRQVRVEVEAIAQERTGAAFDQIQYRRAVGNAFRNSGNLFASPQALDSYIADTSRVTNQSRTKVAQLIDSGLSAQGATTPEDLANVKETIVETLKTYPEVSVEESKVLLQAAQDIRSKNPGMTAREAVGFNLKMGQVARVVDPLAQATNLSPPTANLMSYDMPLQEAGALMAAGTHGMKDWTGEMTGTAMLTMAREIKERLPNLKTFGERLEAFRQHPEWVDAYFQGGMINGKKFDKAETGKGKAEPTIRALFNRDSLDSKRMEEFKAEIGTFESISQFTAKHQADLQHLAGAKIEEIQRTAEAIKQDLRLENARGAMGAVTDVALKDILTAAGVSDLDSERMLFRLRTSGVEPEQKPRELAQKLRAMEEDLRKQGQGEMRPDFVTSWYGNLMTKPIRWWFGDSPSKQDQAQRADMLGAAAGKFDTISEKYAGTSPGKPFLDQFTRDEIEQYRREISSGKKPDTRPMRSRLYALPENSQTGKRAESLVEGIRQKIDDGLSQEEIAGLRGEINYAGSVTGGMGKNPESYLLFGQLDAMRKRLDDADSGALGTAGQIDARLRSGATPEAARGLLPRLEEARQGSQSLPDAERQQLQLRLDALEQAIKAMTDAVEENTRATQKNTGAGESPVTGPQSSRYKPVSSRLGRV